jgi:LEA14-like dessication related protein
MARRALLLSLSAALLLPGCRLLLDLFRAAFTPPALAFKRVELLDVSLGGVTLDTVWQLDNPNGVGLSLATVEYALLVEGRPVLAGAPAQGLQVAPNGSTDLHFPAAVRFAALAGVVETFLTRDSATWRAEGRLGVQTPVGVVSLPLAKEGTFEVPKLPLVAFGAPRVTGLSLQGATVEFPLTVTNRNSYTLPIEEVTGVVSLGGAPLGSLSTGRLGALEAKGTRPAAVSLAVSFLSSGLAVARALQESRTSLAFTAQVRSGAVTVPLRVEQQVSLER